jgi:hypothetical protein
MTSPTVFFTTMVASGSLWPAIFPEILDYSAAVFNPGSVVWRHHTIRIVDFPFIVIDDEEVAAHCCGIAPPMKAATKVAGAW